MITVNQEIRQLNQEKGFEVTNSEVGGAGVDRGFRRDCFHLCEGGSTGRMVSGESSNSFFRGPAGTPDRGVVGSGGNLIVEAGPIKPSLGDGKKL